MPNIEFKMNRYQEGESLTNQKGKALTKNEAAKVIQKYARGMMSRNSFKLMVLNKKKNKIKIYHRILLKDEKYHLVQGYINSNQDIKIVIVDLTHKVVTQELNITNKEVLKQWINTAGHDQDLPNTSFTISSKNEHADIIDYNYLIDMHLDYDDIVQ